MTVKVSVIVPVYNAEMYLKKCLNSILEQTFTDFELICIDDGSSDASLKILTEYAQKDSRIRIFEQNHEGVAAARNWGIKLAQGEFVQFLDADDYFEKDLLEKMLIRVDKYNADIVVCSYRKVDDEGNVVESKNPNSPINLDRIPLETPFTWKNFKNDIFNLLTPIVWNKLIKKSLILDNDIKSPKTRVASDIAFSHSCLAVAKNIVVFDDELINYRFNCAGSIATMRSKCTIDVVHSCQALKEFLIKQGLFLELEKAFINAYKNHLRWDIGLCSDEEYKNFLGAFKLAEPDWKLYSSALKKDYITKEFLYDFIGEKKVMLWGASFFIQSVLKNEKSPNPNILGFVDKNEASWGKFCGNYKIYSPEVLNKLKPDAVIMTIWSNYEVIYPILKKEFEEKYPNIELMPNIFEMD